ncbi:Ataxin-3 [Nesidiocoris tenuis]|uniref:ubiquitinyl hydrolase 1 n=1 Tax=Nesidiocoris tenuis TaxID=355587 RepID=A0ABN7BDY8_9HEMI|nr:Ataxin-3 [Nesidiocoris tenuis]
METIFHEKQEGALCAQHCLNALLQGQYFSAVDLAKLAENVDEQERAVMAESGVDSEEYKRFLQQPSHNMDDSGFFSVQVISSALAVWGLDLVPLASCDPLALEAADRLESQTAYICNYRQHWFTIRKFANQWFNLNSLLSGPELITTFYLSMFIQQLRNEGYSIFVVKGALPACEADEAIALRPVVQMPKKPKQVPLSTNPSDDDLQRAIRLSLTQHDEEDEGLAAALQVSLENDVADDPSLNEAIRMSLRAQAGLSDCDPLPSIGQPSGCIPTQTTSAGDNEEALLQEAIRISLERPASNRPLTAPVPPRPVPAARPRTSDEPDLDEVRRRRLAYLEKQSI